MAAPGIRYQIYLMKPGSIYHLYSHANGFELLFKAEADYALFLEKMVDYLVPIAEIYAYSLLPNHFHFLAEMKSEEEITKLCKHLAPDKRISRSLANALSGFTQKMNHKYSRMGSLFKRNIGHREILDENDFCSVCHYIHANPVHHGYTNFMGEWKYSSYNKLHTNELPWLNSKTVLNYFGGIKNFMIYHQRAIERKDSEKNYF